MRTRFSRPMRQRRRSPWRTRLAWTLAAIVALLFVAAAIRNLRRHDSLTRWRQSLEASAGKPVWPEWSSDWPSLPTPAPRRHRLRQDLQGPYSYAARHTGVLQHIPCYCGCLREGHRSNLNCSVNGFRSDGTPIWTDHSFSCEMCVHIAREVMLMSSPGMSLQRIREEIDTRYSVVGKPTDTPKPGRVESRRR